MSGHEVLLTGFPRLVAKLVADEVLERKPEATVHLLARQKFLREAERFASAPERRGRVRVLEGDAAAIDLGLPGREYGALCERVTHVQHHAHISYEGAPLRDAEALNVGGVREVLELARNAPKLARVVHHSTASVAGTRQGLVREDELDAGQGFRTPIEQTRHRAEDLLWRAGRGLPLTVLRPSVLVGHSQTGETDRLDGPYLVLLVLLNAPRDLSLPMPAGGSTLNLVPVDYVARAAVAVMDEPGALGKALHLVDPAPPDARRVFELLARAAGRRLPRGTIPVQLTRALLRAPGIEKLMKSPRAFLEQLATPVRYSDATARALLEPHGVRCPPLESYVDAIVTYVRDRLAAERRQDEVEVFEVEDPLA